MGEGAAHEPAVGAVLRLEAILDLVAAAGLDRLVPAIEAALQVIGMQDNLPAPVPAFLEGEAGVLEPALVEVLDAAVGLGGPDHLGHGVGEEGVAVESLAQAILGLARLILTAVEQDSPAAGQEGQGYQRRDRESGRVQEGHGGVAEGDGRQEQGRAPRREEGPRIG